MLGAACGVLLGLPMLLAPIIYNTEKKDTAKRECGNEEWYIFSRRVRKLGNRALKRSLYGDNGMSLMPTGEEMGREEMGSSTFSRVEWGS